MKCSKSKLVSPYVDGELGEQDKTLFETHVAGCRECGESLQDALRIRGLFADREQYKAPFGFSGRVMARAAEAERRRFPVFPVPVRFAGAAVVFLMITAGVFSGGVLINAVMDQRMGNFASSFSLEIFEPAPPDSIGGVYLAMTEANNEK